MAHCIVTYRLSWLLLRGPSIVAAVPLSPRNNAIYDVAQLISFQSQLSCHGFRRTNNDDDTYMEAYHHVWFQRDKPELSKQIMNTHEWSKHGPHQHPNPLRRLLRLPKLLLLLED